MRLIFLLYMMLHMPSEVQSQIHCKGEGPDRSIVMLGYSDDQCYAAIAKFNAPGPPGPPGPPGGRGVPGLPGVADATLEMALERIAVLEALVAQYHGSTSTTATTVTVTTTTTSAISALVGENSTAAGTNNGANATIASTTTTTKSTISTILSVFIVAVVIIAFAKFLHDAFDRMASDQTNDSDNTIAYDEESFMPRTPTAESSVATLNDNGSQSNGAVIEAMPSTVAGDGLREVAQTIVNPTYDTGANVETTTTQPAVRLVPNVLYAGNGGHRSAGTQNVKLTQGGDSTSDDRHGNDGSSGVGDGGGPRGTAVPAASAHIPAVYMMPMEDAHSTSNGSASMHSSTGNGDSAYYVDDPISAVAVEISGTAAECVQGHSNHDHANASFNMLAAAVSALPAMSRPEAESKLAAANIDGGFLLRQKTESSKSSKASSSPASSTIHVAISCTTKGVHEHYVMQLVKDADSHDGGKWMHKSHPLPDGSMIGAATTLLKDKLVHSNPQLLLQFDEGGSDASVETRA